MQARLAVRISPLLPTSTCNTRSASMTCSSQQRSYPDAYQPFCFVTCNMNGCSNRNHCMFPLLTHRVMAGSPPERSWQPSFLTPGLIFASASTVSPIKQPCGLSSTGAQKNKNNSDAKSEGSTKPLVLKPIDRSLVRKTLSLLVRQPPLSNARTSC